MFDWDRHNHKKVTDHGLTPAEVKDAFADPDRLGRLLGFVNGEERYVLIGATVAGRVIKAIYTWRGNDIRVVTAFPVRGKELRAYRSQVR